ncbi:hypothetical protein SCP_0412130 [Sparassis crispa]|uniref:Uncharacterized protein n=1 Tax=Sparassis crispa TaxID=139825 RepID=A0A401GKZ3_9APHY|nr:hypothetical protein SCP_0412130 [Sparassis crispa]GBE82826.1 hypothetical protein SCP_0412130 [Sparassis crispa]
MVNYYPPRLTVTQFNRMCRGEWSIVDPDEEMRLQDVAAKKKRGKGVPKKAKSAAESRRAGKRR